jgi:hypothetical protein
MLSSQKVGKSTEFPDAQCLSSSGEINASLFKHGFESIRRQGQGLQSIAQRFSALRKNGLEHADQETLIRFACCGVLAHSEGDDG